MRKRYPKVASSRLAISSGFLLSGIAFASWVVRIPDVQARLSLSEAALGLVLFMVPVGNLAGMPLASWLIARHSSRVVARVAGIVLAFAVGLVQWMPGAWALGAWLLVLGSSTSALAVSVNTQASSLEKRMRRPVVAGLHALYSLGGLIGAGVGALVAGAGVPAGVHLAGTGVLALLVALLGTPKMLPGIFDGSGGRQGGILTLPSRPLLMLGIVAFCCLVGEAAMADWGAVYLTDALAAGPAMAAAGYAAFSLMMATGRFLGDGLRVRLGSAGVVRLGAVTAAFGILLAVGQSSPQLAVIGMGAVGAGLSSIFPTMIAAAGRLRGTPPATNIALLQSMGYVGMLVEAPLIGFVSEATSLRIGFALVGVASLVMVGMSFVLMREGAGVAPALATERL